MNHYIFMATDGMRIMLPRQPAPATHHGNPPPHQCEDEPAVTVSAVPLPWQQRALGPRGVCVCVHACVHLCVCVGGAVHYG